MYNKVSQRSNKQEQYLKQITNKIKKKIFKMI